MPTDPTVLYTAGVEKVGKERGREKRRLLTGQSHLLMIPSSLFNLPLGSKTQGAATNSTLVSGSVPVRFNSTGNNPFHSLFQLTCYLKKISWAEAKPFG